MVEDIGSRVLAQDKNSVLVEKGNIEEFFVDGVGQVTIGPSVSKLRLYKVTNVTLKNNVPFETREIVYSIVLPTPTLFSWLASFAPALKANMPVIEKGTSDTLMMMKKFAASQT